MGKIKVGSPDVRVDAATHVNGIHSGNVGPTTAQPGHHADGTADARRSTGILWPKHDAILKIMPNLPPG